jgi:hypothetical protein
MYHELTTSMVERKRRRRRIVAVVCLLLVALLTIAVLRLRVETREQGAVAMRDSILRTARQCCAAEGSYPSSIEYLENHYGLTVNRREYVISYESFADNIAPSVVVVPR